MNLRALPGSLPAFTLIIATLIGATPVPHAAANGAASRGQVIGARHVQYPDWFSESFLEFAEDSAEAAAAGKHLMLFFDSEGCPYCYKMIEENIKHSPYTDFIRRNFAIIALDIRGAREVAFNQTLTVSETELARHLRVRFTPTLLFLNGDNEAVLRLNGYRSVPDFKHALDYVHTQAYREIDYAGYLAERTRPAVYRFREHPDFVTLANLSTTGERPLMVIFEDTSCQACDDLHDRILQRPDTRELLAALTVVRLDARATDPLIDPAGRHTTAARWARALGLTYRPGVVMFDQGREVMRIDALRWRFHFQQALRYVGERQFRHYPSYQAYARAHRESLLASGQDVDVRE